MERSIMPQMLLHRPAVLSVLCLVMGGLGCEQNADVIVEQSDYEAATTTAKDRFPITFTMPVPASCLPMFPKRRWMMRCDAQATAGRQTTCAKPVAKVHGSSTTAATQRRRKVTEWW